MSQNSHQSFFDPGTLPNHQPPPPEARPPADSAARPPEQPIHPVNPVVPQDAAQPDLPTTVMRLRLEQIKVETDVSPRKDVYNPKAMEQCVLSIDANVPLGLPVVFWDGQVYWLADGFRRVEASWASGKLDVEVEVRRGDKRDAVIHAIRVNANSKGLTLDERRKAARRLLEDDQCSKRGDIWIAGACGLSDKTVTKVRRQIHPRNSEDEVKVRRKGREYSMRIRKISARSANRARANRPQRGKPSNADLATVTEGGGFPQAQTKLQALTPPERVAQIAEELDEKAVEFNRAAPFDSQFIHTIGVERAKKMFENFEDARNRFKQSLEEHQRYHGSRPRP